MKKSVVRRTAFVLLLILLCYGIYYCWNSFPVISGYGAKLMGSAIFVSGRPEDQVRSEDLAGFPFSLGHYTVDYRDSSVTGSVWGLARSKAVYRKGLGVTLVNDISEEELRGQRIELAKPPVIPADTTHWPLGDRIADTLPAGLDTSTLARAIDGIFVEKDSSKPIRTRAVVVVYKGQLVAERYAHNFSMHTPLLGWSMTKSVTGALIGMLVKDGRLQVNAPAPVAEWSAKNDPRHAIRLEDLLQQSSGLDFEEDYTKSSDATKMLFRRADMGAYTASRPLKDRPGSVWYYSSGNSNVLSRIIRRTLGDTAYYKYPYERLFYPLGMYSAVMEPDASGTFVGSSYMYATARDWARFGLLYLQDGVYNGRRLLPEGWVKASTRPAAAAHAGQYGYQLWLNAGTKDRPAERLYTDLPGDCYWADGYEGQHVFVIPSRQLVVVRLGLSRTTGFDADAFLAAVLKAIP